MTSLLASDEDGDVGFGDGGDDGLTTIVVDACSGVGPACFVLREIGIPFLYIRFGNGTDEILWTKHILVFLL